MQAHELPDVRFVFDDEHVRMGGRWLHGHGTISVTQLRGIGHQSIVGGTRWPRVTGA